VKRSPLRDVAGMLRSLHYAPLTVLLRQARAGTLSADDAPTVHRWAHLWYLWSGAAFLRSYLDAAEPGGFLPRAREELEVLLDLYLLEKAVYELGYELNNRPDWVTIPIHGIAELLGTTGPATPTGSAGGPAGAAAGTAG
jgi:maltose alpha-D-glucosyltransferase/alpha-amylase